jgi:hypothetical protein
MPLLTCVLLVGPGLAHAFSPGDLNCDGAINAFDIDPFVLALTDPAGYAEEYPDCDYMLADINGDGVVNAFDIDPFVALLTAPQAACCYPDGTCAVTTEANCDGVWHPEWADCAVAQCPQPTAACCYPDGTCAVTTEAGCDGVWHPEWADCAVAQCPQPTAACCHPDGTCAVTTEDDCDGVWHPEWVDCAVAQCPQPTAACCYPDGTCAVTTEADCAGIWHPEWTNCALAQCPQPTAACCHSDGTCAVTTEADCDGVWHPEWADCDVAQCPQPTAACCYPDGTCAVTTQADCDGAWHPEWPTCAVADCPDLGALTAIELAGNSLTAYPYFEYVRAFHQNAAIKLALDPTLHPSIVGRTADVYIVEKKTPAEWAADPTLIDVTAGGSMAVTFTGSTVQANTFQITGPGELSAAVFQDHTGANTGLGHGYDMIVDMNRNGDLDDGDYIDGLSDEAGLYVCHDTTTAGPLAVTETLYTVGTIFGIPATVNGQNLYYPSDIASMGKLPLLVISHGNGHNYRWYDHIGYHMASYGFIVMSHGNNTGPSSGLYASLTTCGHTDAFFHLLASIDDGALVGHVDSNRIIWCGHSRGAEGVAFAYHRISVADSYHYTPTYYSADDIVLVDSMLPVDFFGPSRSNPGPANFHLWTAAGDSDVHGGATSDIAQTFHIHERATNFRSSTVVQGTGHGWFHDAGSAGAYFTGPCPINESGTHLVQLGIMLPMYKHYAEGNIPGQDYLWRQYERFHPPAVPVGTDPCYVVSQEYRNGAADGIAFIDDYETQTAANTSSSGGAVTYTVTNLTEGRLDDATSSFSWSASDPFNGATQDGASDTGRGVVFDWNDTDRYYEWAVVSGLRDFSAWKYVGVRGAQGTQHPYTLETDGLLTFTITQRDGAGNTSSINSGAYGGGFGMPYERSGGWHNEMRRIRIRITDFLANGSNIDLTNIVAVRLNVGPSWGTSQGRIVIDELMLDNDLPPAGGL